ncbi:DUF2062 domain-containing protein [Desulfotalea psychrophila]|uniref:Related to dolichyl-phosphate mannose synthase n=1 Tax=Desulfotalea psychrophila (strain LSv54 / DSM 12343) TaxID=177439 RepID=Q6AM44_DESPS|nr:DUF2062 domain-containing protein [Desulfotalea psychrophila]CAG36581.1 related to dolichyl-phosphate mannose synthase [Desulfotalea psychrophila LSv54]
MKLDNAKILIVIPLYNHGTSVAAVATRALETGLPVLVVDDGSTDSGLQSLKGQGCATLRLTENRGKGAAIKTGASYALENGYQAIVTVDADGQHSPLEIPLLVAEANRGPWPAIIIGAREMIQDTVPRSSHFGKAFSNFWVRLECGCELADTQSGMRLYPVEEILALDLPHCCYDFEIEVLVKSVWSGLEVRDVPVSVHYPPADERVSHFRKGLDNWRLTKLHTTLVCRRLLPLPHKQLVEGKAKLEPLEDAKHPLRTLKRICQENSSPFWLAVAVFSGLFLGALPLIACHTLAIIYFCCRLHLNKVAAVAASQFCMPPLIPALCIELGHYMLHGEFIYDLSWQRWLLEIPERVWEWLLGSLVVGPVLGLVGASLVYFSSRKFILLRSQKGETP